MEIRMQVPLGKRLSIACAAGTHYNQVWIFLWPSAIRQAARLLYRLLKTCRECRAALGVAQWLAQRLRLEAMADVETGRQVASDHIHKSQQRANKQQQT